MFKNAIVFTTAAGFKPSVEELEAALAGQPYRPCEPSQSASFGWVPPRGQEHGTLVESIAAQSIMRFMQETKTVAPNALKKLVQQKMDAYEAQTGTKVGRKGKKDLTEEAMLELLPTAASRIQGFYVWMDPANSRLVLDCSTINKTDLIITALVGLCEGITAVPLSNHIDAQGSMTEWLLMNDEDWPSGFAPGRQVTLESTNETRATVKFSRHHLDPEQMKLHISQGKRPTELGLEWEGKVGFVLGKAGNLKGIKLLDLDKAGDAADTGAQGQNAADDFDADIAIATGTISQLITSLMEAMHKDEQGAVPSVSDNATLEHQVGAVNEDRMAMAA